MPAACKQHSQRNGQPAPNTIAVGTKSTECTLPYVTCISSARVAVVAWCSHFCYWKPRREVSRSKMQTAAQMLKKINPSCPSCIPPSLKLHCCFPVDHPLDLTHTHFVWTSRRRPARPAQALHLTAPVAPGHGIHHLPMAQAKTAPPSRGGMTLCTSLHGQQQEPISPLLGRALGPAPTK